MTPLNIALPTWEGTDAVFCRSILTACQTENAHDYIHCMRPISSPKSSARRLDGHFVCYAFGRLLTTLGYIVKIKPLMYSAHRDDPKIRAYAPRALGMHVYIGILSPSLASAAYLEKFTIRKTTPGIQNA